MLAGLLGLLCNGAYSAGRHSALRELNLAPKMSPTDMLKSQPLKATVPSMPPPPMPPPSLPPSPPSPCSRFQEAWGSPVHVEISDTVVGEGFFGTVFEGFLGDEGCTHRVAVKIPRKKSPLGEQRCLVELLHDLEVCSRVGTIPNLVRCLGWCLVNHLPATIWELVDGTPLPAALEQHASGQSMRPLALSRSIADTLSCCNKAGLVLHLVLGTVGWPVYGQLQWKVC